VISRRYLGLDLRPRQLGAVALCRKGRSVTVVGGRVVSLPDDVVNPSLRTPNIIDRPRLVAALRDVLHPISGREERLAVALPEGAGRVLLVDVEMPFKSKAEGLQILRWQLRNALPVDPAELCLDYQILERKEDGGLRLAVAVMTRAVLEQYEGVLVEAGYHGVVIDFHSLQLYNYYRPRLDLGTETIFVSVEDGALSMQCFEDHRLMFHRSREIGHDLDMVFRELTRSLVAARDLCPGLRRSQLFVHTDWLEQESLREALRMLFEREPTLLDPHLQRLTEGDIDLPDWRAKGLVAAVGAAERLM